MKDKAPRSSRSVPVRRAVHELRLIGGAWRRTRLPVLDAPGLRPTPDRVRETLFNWLAHRAGGASLAGWRCVDAFAGTGALGLEAASRGAQAVLLVESQPALAAALRALIERLGAGAVVTLRRGDGVAALRALAPGSVDLVLLDPPFEQPALYSAALAAAAPALAPGGVLYLEAAEAWDAARLAPLGWQVLRHLRAGQVHAHLLQRAQPPGVDAAPDEVPDARAAQAALARGA